MPPAYVKPYVKRQKNDSTDAEAICEAGTRPNMRFVPTKAVEQQSCLTARKQRLYAAFEGSSARYVPPCSRSSWP
jgi:transposase